MTIRRLGVVLGVLTAVVIVCVLNIRTKRRPTWPIETAGSGDLKQAESLPAGGAKVNAKDEDGRTALMRAAEEGSAEIVKALLAAGAEVNLRADDGTTALMYASGSGLIGYPVDNKDRVESVKALLVAGADVNAWDNKGKTALMIASHWGDEEVVNVLLANGADVDARDNEGRTALGTATRNLEYLGIVKLLLDRRAEVYAAHVRGNSPARAAYEGDREAVQELIVTDADVNAASKFGYTALMLAAYKGQRERVEALLAKGADVDAKDKDGWTALMLAACTGREEIVKALLAHGADVNVQDEEGSTALEWAYKYGHTAVTRTSSGQRRQGLFDIDRRRGKRRCRHREAPSRGGRG